MPTLNSVLVNKIKVVLLSPESRSTLLTGYKQGKTRSYRLRCQALLLKSDVTKPRTSLAVAEQIGCCEMAVNNWMKRYWSAPILCTSGCVSLRRFLTAFSAVIGKLVGRLVAQTTVRSLRVIPSAPHLDSGLCVLLR